MVTQELIEKLVDDLETLVTSKLESVEFDQAYQRIVGCDRDPMLKVAELQRTAGAIFMGAYFSKSSREDPAKRLTPSLQDIVPVADKKIIGFAYQSNLVLQKMSKLMANGIFLSVVDSIPEWRSAPITVRKSMAARINALTILAGSLTPDLDDDIGKKMALGAEFNDVFDAFMKKLELFLEEAYGAYIPPPPPPKKGFWGSIFG